MTRKLLFVAVGIAAFTMAGAAFAQAPGPHGPAGGPFAFDANQDGVLTRQEFDAGHAARFASADANHDGALSGEEHRAAHHAMMGAMMEHHRMGGGHRRMEHMAMADANHDGNISREEFLAHPSQMFDRLDANHDGVLSANERPARGEHGPGHGRREHGGGDGSHERHGPDANNDGAISRAEFDAHGAEMFGRLDANHDGRVTREEAEQMHGEHRRSR